MIKLGLALTQSEDGKITVEVKRYDDRNENSLLSLEETMLSLPGNDPVEIKDLLHKIRRRCKKMKLKDVSVNGMSA